MAELTYRDAVARAIAQEMERDPSVVFLGEDVAAAGGVFKATVGLLEQFGPAARPRHTDLRTGHPRRGDGRRDDRAATDRRDHVRDFFAVCWDIVANEIAKSRYMTDGQVTLPLVIRTANGGGLRFGAQHSQSVENWAMAIPGLKVVAPSTPGRHDRPVRRGGPRPDPVLFFEHKGLYSSKARSPTARSSTRSARRRCSAKATT